MISEFHVKDNSLWFQMFVLEHYNMHNDTQKFIQNEEPIGQLSSQYLVAKIIKFAKSEPIYQKLIRIFAPIYIWFVLILSFTIIVGIDNFIRRLAIICMITTSIAFIIAIVTLLVMIQIASKDYRRWIIMRPRNEYDDKTYHYLFFTDDEQKKTVLAKVNQLDAKSKDHVNAIKVPKQIEYMLVTKDAVCCFDKDLKLVFGGSIDYLDELKKHISVRYLDVAAMYSLSDIEEH